MTLHTCLLTLLFAVPVAAQVPQGKGSLSGHVVSSVADAPIAGATVQLDSSDLRSVSDSLGGFHLDSIDPGVYLLHVKAIGYEEGAWRVRVHPGQAMDHAFELTPQVVQLPGVSVNARPGLAARHFADFERRRHTGMGYYITQDDIEKTNASSLVDVLVMAHGVEQVCLVNDCIAKMVRSPPGCYPQYFLDGNESTAYFARHTPPKDVKGIEVYRGQSEMPGEFTGSNSACGVIAIWTKSSP